MHEEVHEYLSWIVVSLVIEIDIPCVVVWISHLKHLK